MSVSAPAYRTEGPGNKFRPKTLRNFFGVSKGGAKF